MLRQTPNRRHRWLAPANSDLESSYESRPGYHTVEVHTQAGPTQVSLHNHAVEALVVLAPAGSPAWDSRIGTACWCRIPCQSRRTSASGDHICTSELAAPQ